MDRRAEDRTSLLTFVNERVAGPAFPRDRHAKDNLVWVHSRAANAFADPAHSSEALQCRPDHIALCVCVLLHKVYT